MNRTARILVVDEEPLVRRSIARSLHRMGHDVDHIPTGAAALELVRQHTYDVSIVNYTLADDVDSLSLLSQIKGQQPLCMPVLMTGAVDFQTAVDALHRAEVVSILQKPFDQSGIQDAVKRALLKQEQLRPLEQERQLAVSSHRMFEECRREKMTCLALQPIVSARHPGRIVALECLLRSRHPVLKGPEQLLEATEHARQVWALGRMVNELAAEVATIIPSGVLLFVNMHPHQLDDPDLMHQFEPLFASASRIVLEITERAGLGGVPNWDAAVQKLTSQGFQFAVDDLGAGHNGLLLLAQLQPTFIKVDQSIVRGVHLEPRKQRLISMLANFAESTGASLVAEGVETAEEAQTLVETGAHLLQGYHLRGPVWTGQFLVFPPARPEKDDRRPEAWQDGDMRRFWWLWILAGCSDYQINGKDGNAGGGDPDIVVDPGSLSLVGVCGSEQSQVTITNQGGSPLTITGIEVNGEGWSREAMVLPLVLEAGESTVVLLNSGGGEAILEIFSDDPDESVVDVDLTALPDAPPSVKIDWPADGDVIQEGQDLVVQGTVSDDVDPPETLVLSWESDSGGILSTDPAATDGTSGFDWPASARATGTQTLSFSATDSCGQKSTTTARICQDGAYTYDALSLASWHYEGTAAWDATNSYLVLTEAVTNVVGTAFETSHPVDGSLVDIQFQFYIGDGTGADGISLTALDTNRMTTFLGGNGCGIGFGGDAPCTAGPALPGWSIEVDTYYNFEADPTTDDHVTFMFDGDVDNPQVWATLPEMENTGWHLMEVNVSAPHVRVAIDGTTYIDQDLSGNFSFPAYVGFTAGTGGLTNRHLIDDLQVTDYYCQ